MSEEGVREESKHIRTFRDVYIEKGYSQTKLARRTGLSRMTIWNMNNKKGNVWFSSVQAACNEVGISLDEYASLDPCPHADEYRPKGKKK